jgi:polyphosphate kinase 2 (PPK2 family)
MMNYFGQTPNRKDEDEKEETRDEQQHQQQANEVTPLLLGVPTNRKKNDKNKHRNGKQLWGELRAATWLTFTRYRRTSLTQMKGNSEQQQQRKSLRLAIDDLFADHHGMTLEPVDALSPLVTGGVIVCTDKYRTTPRPPSTVKSLPAYAPFRRTERHRSFTLWWINEFRHWWKSSRLLVRLAGLWTLAITAEFLLKMQMFAPYKKHHKANIHNIEKAVRIVKKLGRGGPMRWFLQTVQPFTRTIRILVAVWRWIEAAQCRRLEVGVEEFMAFTGNRVSRILARTAVDMLVMYIGMPIAGYLFRDLNINEDKYWIPVLFFVVFGILRACSPYAASFQGSRVGRVITRQFFTSLKLRWQPIMRIQNLNLQSDDCCEQDEVSENADLVKVAKLIAKALGQSQQIGIDGVTEQAMALAAEGFQQVGAGSGGYAVYICHRRVWNAQTDTEGEETPILLHITPYGPSILDVMPRYIVLEFEASVDRRAKWSEFLSRKIYEGPPVVEGYCYEGAFFSPHHFAQLKTRYDKEMLAYDNACRVMCKPRTGRKPNPPSDHASLKAFLAAGKRPRKRKRNERDYRILQGRVHTLAKQLQALRRKGTAPRGVILYFEGLDCSGKSSTGGLVQQVLEDAGYNVGMRQFNRPPTEEQKLHPWMNRFDTPEPGVIYGVKDATLNPEDIVNDCHAHHDALVWDRGPAGDFVYGELGKASDEVRAERFREFRAFDERMYQQGVLFCKLLFVTTRDSIASTLGKRLAQRKMAKDLHIWLQASRGGDSTYGNQGFEGLDEITLHIDPTDFVAFNRYQKNLRIFTNVALNTDTNENPWLVVNTTDRFAARAQLLRAFSGQVQRYQARHRSAAPCCLPPSSSVSSSMTLPLHNTPAATASSKNNKGSDRQVLTVDEVERGFVKPTPISGLLALAGLIFLLYWYADHTTFGRNIDTFVTWMATEKGGTGDDGVATSPVSNTALRLLMEAVFAV